MATPSARWPVYCSQPKAELVTSVDLTSMLINVTNTSSYDSAQAETRSQQASSVDSWSSRAQDKAV